MTGYLIAFALGFLVSELKRKRKKSPRVRALEHLNAEIDARQKWLAPKMWE